MPDQLSEALSEFVRFARSLRGDEKSEAQTFLDHFFRVLGPAEVIEAGATFEFRVAKKPGSVRSELVVGGGVDPVRPKGGKKFADLLGGKLCDLFVGLFRQITTREPAYGDPSFPGQVALGRSLQEQRGGALRRVREDNYFP